MKSSSNCSDDVNDKFHITSTLQKASGYLAVLCAIITEILVVQWMKGTSDGYLGGLNWNGLLFNYHPVFMTGGMILSFFTAAVSFRILPFGKMINKRVHGIMHVLSVFCIVVGLTAVFMGNNYKSKSGGIYYANLYSLHSFIGLTTIALYIMNVCSGAVVFGFSETFKIEPVVKAALLPIHVFLGTVLIFFATTTVETGIMELATEVGCTYDVTQVDYNPAKHYDRLYEACQVANGAGLMALFSCFFTAFAILGNKTEATSKKTDGNGPLSESFDVPKL